MYIIYKSLSKKSQEVESCDFLLRELKGGGACEFIRSVSHDTKYFFATKNEPIVCGSIVMEYISIPFPPKAISSEILRSNAKSPFFADAVYPEHGLTRFISKGQFS